MSIANFGSNKTIRFPFVLSLSKYERKSLCQNKNYPSTDSGRTIMYFSDTTIHHSHLYSSFAIMLQFTPKGDHAAPHRDDQLK